MPPKGTKKTKPAAPLDYSALTKGMRLQADDGTGYFYAAEVVEVSDSKKRAKAPVKVHFVGYTADSDVWVGGDRIRSKALKPKKEEVEKKPREPQRVFLFALTGGPCGGKGSCQKYLKEKLEAKGYDVYFCPEGPTIFFNNGGLNAFFPNGFPPEGKSLIDALPESKDKLMQFESAVIQLQRQMEEGFKTMARTTGKKSVIFCDRGIFDIACYLPGMATGDAWKALLKQNKMVEIKMLARYTGVIHLQTAAIGAEKHYKSGDTTDDAGNKVFRRESPEEAKTLDANVAECWSKHKNLVKVENDASWTSVDSKWEKALEAVLKAVE